MSIPTDETREEETKRMLTYQLYDSSIVDYKMSAIVNKAYAFLQSEITKAQEQLLDELETELKPEGIVMQGNMMMYKCNVEAMIENKRQELKERKL